MNRVIIGSDNGLSPVWCQAIIWTNAVLLSIGPLGTNFSQIVFEIQTFSFKKMHLKMSSGKYQPFCLGLNVLIRVPVNASHASIKYSCTNIFHRRSLYTFYINWWHNHNKTKHNKIMYTFFLKMYSIYQCDLYSRTTATDDMQIHSGDYMHLHQSILTIVTCNQRCRETCILQRAISRKCT